MATGIGRERLEQRRRLTGVVVEDAKLPAERVERDAVLRADVLQIANDLLPGSRLVSPTCVEAVEEDGGDTDGGAFDVPIGADSGGGSRGWTCRLLGRLEGKHTDVLRLAIVFENKVVPGEAGDGVSVPIADHDVDLDEARGGAYHDGGRLRGFLRLSKQGGAEQRKCAQRAPPCIEDHHDCP